MEYLRAIKVNKPEWFLDSDFMQAINERYLASWHKTGSEAGEFSDVFMMFHVNRDLIEGCPTYLEDSEIYADVVETIVASGVSSGIVWVTNLS